ncbi:MAG: hypothetical protein Q8O67_33720 [Deltaproteobacteria bacterium]|nr:hypothetical protein [Deltaproteobacteria bacterium]
MADQSFLQRGLTGFRDTMRGVGQAMGKAAQGAAKKAKASMGNVKKSMGFSDVDAFNDDVETERRKNKARKFFGDDEPSFVGVRTEDPKRDLSTVAPEFRGQVSSGLAAANSQTAGSTLVDRGAAGGSGGGNGGGGNNRW